MIQVAPKIKAMMMECGNTMVGYQPLDDIPNFFRMVISNPASTTADIDFLVDEIERLGEELWTRLTRDGAIRVTDALAGFIDKIHLTDQ